MCLADGEPRLRDGSGGVAHPLRSNMWTKQALHSQCLEIDTSQQFTHQKFHGECTGGLRESSSLCANEKNDLINILP